MVLDALDECTELEFENLIRNIEGQFQNSDSDYSKVKYLLTSRPYSQIVSQFHELLQTFPDVRIPGEEASEDISKEVNLVITHRVRQLAEKKRFTPEIKKHLEQLLQESTHRTYLWVYLVFDYLEKEDFKTTRKGVASAISTLPKTVNDAYEKILYKSKDDLMVRHVLCIILAAGRPLTLAEMNIAVNLEETMDSFHDLDLEKEEDFERRLRSWCGLFISVYRGRVYFIHQTAREFLISVQVHGTAAPSPQGRWCHSISMDHAHAILAKVCVVYLNLFNSDLGVAIITGEYSIDEGAFLDYTSET